MSRYDTKCVSLILFIIIYPTVSSIFLFCESLETGNSAFFFNRNNNNYIRNNLQRSSRYSIFQRELNIPSNIYDLHKLCLIQPFFYSVKNQIFPLFHQSTHDIPKQQFTYQVTFFALFHDSVSSEKSFPFATPGTRVHKRKKLISHQIIICMRPDDDWSKSTLIIRLSKVVIEKKRNWRSSRDSTIVKK